MQSEDKGDEKPRLADLISLSSNEGEKIEIVNSVASSWKHIGALMDFDEAGDRLDLTQEMFGDPVACCKDVFQHWLRGNGKQPATWRTLIELLEDIHYRDLAKKVRKAVKF